MQEEFIAYSPGKDSLFAPLIASVSSNGSEYRQLMRVDIQRILDPKQIPGGWLFKQASGGSSVVRRFTIIRGGFLFFFHSPLNDRPVALYPLLGCSVTLPSGSDEEKESSNGYGFEIHHPNRDTLSLYAVSESERNEWVDVCTNRIAFSQEISNNDITEAGSNITITASKLKQNESVSLNATTRIKAVPLVGISGNPFGQPPQSDDEISKYDDSSLDDTVGPPSIPPPELDNDNNDDDNDNDDKTESKSDSIAVTTFTSMEQEGQARAKNAIKERRNSIVDQVKLEAENPLHVSELMKYLIFFTGEDLIRDPPSDATLKIPYLSGIIAESILIKVYQHYINPATGYMCLEEVINFMEDSNILNSHSPHNDNDEANEEFRRLMDPIRLITSIPRNLGYTTEMIVGQKGKVVGTRRGGVNNNAKVEDKFFVNFTQFYQLLIQITEIIYPEIYNNPAPSNPCGKTIAFNKFMHEIVIPMYVFSFHSKRGCTDPLLLETRIPLALNMYAPNLWKLFCLYGNDNTGKAPIPQKTEKYPSSAQIAEKNLFGLPSGVRHENNFPNSSKDFVTLPENSMLRMFTDFGITPQLLSRSDAKKLYAQVCQEKKLDKIITKVLAPTAARTTTLASSLKRSTPSSKQPVGGLFFGQAEATRLANPPTGPPTSNSVVPSSTPNPGLSFSEFLELIAKVAVDGLKQENYNIMFPSDFSKVLGLLTVWGLANPKKIEEIKIFHFDDRS